MTSAFPASGQLAFSVSSSIIASASLLLSTSHVFLLRIIYHNKCLSTPHPPLMFSWSFLLFPQGRGSEIRSQCSLHFSAPGYAFRHSGQLAFSVSSSIIASASLVLTTPDVFLEKNYLSSQMPLYSPSTSHVLFSWSFLLLSQGRDLRSKYLNSHNQSSKDRLEI